MDIASLGNTNTNHTESNRERLARLRAFIAYAEELEAYYFLHYCVYMQKHEEHHKDLKKFREVVLPSIGNENDIRYTTVVATHNELVANDKALMANRSDSIVGRGPRLDTLDKEVVKIQTRLQEIIARLNYLQAKMQLGFKIYASDIAKEMEDIAYYDDSMTLATCFFERARLEVQPKMRAFATETSKLEKHIEQNGLAVHKYILDTNPANTWFLDLNRAQKP
ncbi:hypothetical protein B5807_00122 [Epicoccum nigrum]|uniref:Uncharacterized protein n=1 Tax=Epicoccum nigrum TaxID=105696 RepID=A0A1Y2MIM0_EPING|nr:hypothetical protein B5807_00122 [Epicoccum nigrum]